MQETLINRAEPQYNLNIPGAMLYKWLFPMALYKPIFQHNVIDDFAIAWYNDAYATMEQNLKPSLGLRLSTFLPDAYNQWVGVFSQVLHTHKGTSVEDYYSERLKRRFERVDVMLVLKGNVELIGICFVPQRDPTQKSYLSGLEDAFSLVLDEAEKNGCSRGFRAKILQLALFSQAVASATRHEPQRTPL